MRHRELLAAISDLEPIEIEGEFDRHSSLRWDELKPSAAGGRWGTRRAFEVLYLGRPRMSVVVEAYRHLVDDELDDSQALASAVLERRVMSCRVAVSNILDLRPTSVQSALALTDAQLLSQVGDYASCQAVGSAAHQLGLGGLIAPAATRLGETLALFPTNLPIAQWPQSLLVRSGMDSLQVLEDCAPLTKPADGFDTIAERLTPALGQLGASRSGRRWSARLLRSRRGARVGFAGR